MSQTRRDRARKAHLAWAAAGAGACTVAGTKPGRAARSGSSPAGRLVAAVVLVDHDGVGVQAAPPDELLPRGGMSMVIGNTRHASGACAWMNRLTCSSFPRIRMYSADEVVGRLGST